MDVITGATVTTKRPSESIPSHKDFIIGGDVVTPTPPSISDNGNCMALPDGGLLCGGKGTDIIAPEPLGYEGHELPDPSRSSVVGYAFVTHIGDTAIEALIVG